MAEAAGYLDALFVFGWFLIGCYCAWPDEQMPAKTVWFGYGVLGLVVARVILWATT
jgi:hypothetical protein